MYTCYMLNIRSSLTNYQHALEYQADDEVLLNVLRCRLTYEGQAVTSAEAWFNIALRNTSFTSIQAADIWLGVGDGGGNTRFRI